MGAKITLKKYYICSSPVWPSDSFKTKRGQQGRGRRLGLWAHQTVDKDCCLSSSLLSQLSAFDFFFIRLAKSPTDVSFVSSFKIHLSISTQVLNSFKNHCLFINARKGRRASIDHPWPGATVQTLMFPSQVKKSQVMNKIFFLLSFIFRIIIILSLHLRSWIRYSYYWLCSCSSSSLVILSQNTKKWNSTKAASTT